jgi:transcriptional regulator with XRE-family HTH domain
VPAKTGLGERIKRLRLSRDLTLKEVEREAQVSATHISEIERGLTSPTVGALMRIAAALGVPASRIVGEGGAPRVSLVRAGERRVLVDPRSSMRLHSLSTGVAGARLSLVEVEVGTERTDVSPRIAHHGESFFHILRGVVEIEVSGRRRILKEGESVHHRTREPHVFRNIGDGTARVLWVATPPAWL